MGEGTTETEGGKQVTMRGRFRGRDQVADEIARNAHEVDERIIKEARITDLFDRIKAEVEVRGTTTH